MEAGRSSNLERKSGTIRAPKPGVVIHEPSEIINVTDDSNNFNTQETFKRGADQYMPITNIIKIMRRVLPPNAKIADDAKETIQECVSEFINFVTTEANAKCHQEYRKTINPKDVISAMYKLGFNNYIEPLNVYSNKIQNEDFGQNSAQQAPFVKRSASFMQLEPQIIGPPPRPGYAMPETQMIGPPLPPSYAMPPTNYASYRDNYVGSSHMNEYGIRVAGGHSQGSSSNSVFGPYEQFK